MDWVEAFVQSSNTILANSVTNYLAAFAVAAWIHSGRVKREIKTQVGALVIAINGLGEALREDMKKQSQRIDFVETEVTAMQSKLTEHFETEH